ncbi:hypothetical protein HDU82_009329 [Entophlyctis luteolus]|nr:hypothetical protein HDU82_009329 [Entophlyctis luteolus]
MSLSSSNHTHTHSHSHSHHHHQNNQHNHHHHHHHHFSPPSPTPPSAPLSPAQSSPPPLAPLPRVHTNQPLLHVDVAVAVAVAVAVDRKLERLSQLAATAAMVPPSDTTATLIPTAAAAAAASTTTLRISVKQRNGSIATITTAPAKVTRGFDAPAASTSSTAAGDSTSMTAADLLPCSSAYPPQLLGVVAGGSRTSPASRVGSHGASNAPLSASTASPASRSSLVDMASSAGACGNGATSVPAIPGVFNTRRIYSNVSTSSTASLQTFFGVGEGQVLKERLMREQELRDQQQQALWIEQQQALVRQQQRQMQRSRNARKQKASFAIGNANGDAGFAGGDGGDDDDDDDDDDNADSAIGDDGDDHDDAQQHSAGGTGIRSVSSLASLKSPESGLRLFGSLVSAGSNSPHLLTRRTFPSAPYLPLYSLPNRPDSPAAPVRAGAKLLLNPNPNSSSAADIPNLARNAAGNSSADTEGIKSTAAATGVGADSAAPVAITRVSGGSGGIDSNTKAAPPQPAEIQAPLHGTPATATAPPSDADLQAAAAAARARGHNLPRNIPDFYRRLQDLRAANIRQLEALRIQIDGLRGSRNGADVAYYEKEMRTLVEALRRDEAALVDFGRRGLGIDVNTLSLMLSNLPMYDPAPGSSSSGGAQASSSSTVGTPAAGTHAHEYPNTMDLMRRTKSSAHLATAPVNGGGGWLRTSQSHQRIPAVAAAAASASASSSSAFILPASTGAAAAVGRMRTQTTATARIALSSAAAAGSGAGAGSSSSSGSSAIFSTVGRLPQGAAGAGLGRGGAGSRGVTGLGVGL